MDDLNCEKKGSSGSRGTYGQWQDVSLKHAVKAVVMYKWSIKKAAEIHGVPRSTLHRYLKQCHIDGSVEKKAMGRHCTMSPAQEDELSTILQEMESRLYGLSPTELRKVVYQFCELNKLSHNFDNEKKSAGRKWLKYFLGRHPELSVRKAEGVSLQRACGYNISKVKIFEQILKNELFTEDGQRKIPVENIFNVDETGITVNQKPKRILAKKGKKTIGVVTSLEKGKTITAVCCVSAAGVYCPPFLIFPRKRMKAELLDRGPPGTVGVANKSGWINEEIFVKWFEHFLNIFQPKCRSSPSLLIMDGHASHTNSLQLIMRARDNNVKILILPSHTTHKIQPLDVTVFKSLKSHYDRAVDSWLRAHPGRGVQESNVAELFAEAWGKAATVANATSGFRKSRIEPFGEVNADDEEFLGADVTDVPQSTADSVLQNDIPTSSSALESVTATAVADVAIPSSTEVILADVTANESVSTVPESDTATSSSSLNTVTVTSVTDVATTSSTQVTVAVEEPVTFVADSFASSTTPRRSLIVIPKRARASRSKQREVSHAKMITSSPYKRKLLNAEEDWKRSRIKQMQRENGVRKRLRGRRRKLRAS